MSVHKLRTPIVASTFILLGIVSFFLFYVPALSMDETWAVVYFTEEVELDEVIDATSRYDVRLITMLREYDVDGVLRTDGYNLEFDDWRDIEELRGLYWQSHGIMLEDIRSQEAMYRTLETLEASFAAIDGCWEDHSCPEVWVVRLEVLGSVDTLAKMADEIPFIDYVEIESRGEAPSIDGRTGEALPAVDDTSASASPNADDATNSLISNWLPSSGTITIFPSSTSGQRYVLHTVRWNTASRVAGFAANSAYEHDFFLNDSDNSQHGPGTYLDDSAHANQVPIVAHWSSSLPRAYLDTRLGDASYLKAFTVGSADGDAIQHNVTYDTYIRTVDGDATVDNAFLKAQLGSRTPSWCYTTWCVFGSQQVFIYPEYEVDTIPGSFSWTMRELNEGIWRGDEGWTRAIAIDSSDNLQWDIAQGWSGPINISALPGSGTLQAQTNYRVGNNFIQAIWRGDQGWSRIIPISNDGIQWGQAPAWSGPVSIGSLPGSGSVQAHGDYATTNTLVQGIWRSNEGWTRNVPIVNGVIQWSQAGNWAGPISIGGLPGSGDIQAQDNFVVGNTYWQSIWRSDWQYSRSVPIVNGSIQWNQASAWSNTTVQENLSGTGSVQTQANYVFP